MQNIISGLGCQFIHRYSADAIYSADTLQAEEERKIIEINKRQVSVSRRKSL